MKKAKSSSKSKNSNAVEYVLIGGNYYIKHALKNVYFGSWNDHEKTKG